MGKLVAVCSDDKKSGKSIVTYLLAKEIKKSSGKHLKILVCCLNMNYSSLYKLFGIDCSDVGMEELVNLKLFDGNRSDILYSIVPQSDGIYFLGSYRTTKAFIHRNIQQYYLLFDKLKDSYDLIIFDTASSNENMLSGYILFKADVLIKLFIQDNDSMRKLNCKGGIPLQDGRETIYIVSKYRNIYPRFSDIKRRYSLKKIFKIDYCEKLQEMKNRDSLHLYSCHDTSCNDSVKRISEYIAETMSLISKEQPIRELRGKYKRNIRNTLKKLKLIDDGGEEHEDTSGFMPERVNELY
ncbi:hypothetical protein LY28_00957 [Ruminiclostridium sufflavum DSM 19573]|uniref:Cellulose biosynthesis protein BcsQ n=1 Tax=Ruminiclostridium sufflavum DSM 19573 TaxID=1121337 RepID=A0A318XRQ6_9FIRM|nr:hypothetical protein [Ruminiclostridium sufflavum]PYG89134.1 hypothetical protein LY28_00957 [Ruminiclostridium sufflavum DSM 19573]